MTPNDAIAIIRDRAAGRTRWEGQQPFADEVLVEEIERLTRELAALDSSHRDLAKRLAEMGEENQKYHSALWRISLGKSDGLDHAEDVLRLERAIKIARSAVSTS